MSQQTLRAILQRDRARILRETDPSTIHTLRVRMASTIAAISGGVS